MRDRRQVADGLAQDIVLQPHENRAYVHTYGTHDDQHKAFAAELRKEGGVRDRDGLGRLALTIPPGDYQALRRANPDLASSDAKVRTAAWKKFMRSPESLPYRVRDKI